MLFHAIGKQAFKGFSDILSITCTCLKVTKASLLGPSACFVFFHLSVLGLAFVSAHHHFDPICVCSESLHFFFPVDQTAIAVPVIHVKDHDNSAGVFVKLGSDHFVIIVAREVKEVDADFLA